MARWAFDLLGMEATKDVRQIKRAYAALVRKYHPEEHPAEWARIHEAYQAAMQYAQMPETGISGQEDAEIQDVLKRENVLWIEEGPGEAWTAKQRREEKFEEIRIGEEGNEEEPEIWMQQNREVTEDTDYGEMFREVQSYRVREMTQHEQELQQRLQKLVSFRQKGDVKEWRYFFEREFLPNEGVDELCLLLNTVRDNSLPGKTLRIIQPEMESRAEDYASRGEHLCRQIAEEIITCCKEKQAAYKKAQQEASSPRRQLLIAVIVGLVLLFRGVLDSRDGHVEGGTVSVKTAAASHLNGKYDIKDYTIGTLDVDWEELTDAYGEGIIYYRIRKKGFGELSACAIQNPEDENHVYQMIFDCMQAEEIKQAFEERVNGRTGYAQGRLFWDSSMYLTFEGVKDGFFQTLYQGDFDAFIQEETAVRKNVPESANAYLAADSSELNGICEYYLPESALQIGNENPGGEVPEAEGLKAALETCAADYRVLIRCAVLPEQQFKEITEAASSGEADIWALRDAVEEEYIFAVYPAEEATEGGNQ